MNSLSSFDQQRLVDQLVGRGARLAGKAKKQAVLDLEALDGEQALLAIKQIDQRIQRMELLGFVSLLAPWAVIAATTIFISIRGPHPHFTLAGIVFDTWLTLLAGALVGKMVGVFFFCRSSLLNELYPRLCRAETIDLLIVKIAKDRKESPTNRSLASERPLGEAILRQMLKMGQLNQESIRLILRRTNRYWELLDRGPEIAEAGRAAIGRLPKKNIAPEIAETLSDLAGRKPTCNAHRLLIETAQSFQTSDNQLDRDPFNAAAKLSSGSSKSRLS